MNRRALFLDRDGVINVDYGYVHRPQDVTYVEGIDELISLANQLGYMTIIVTNQAGIGRGLYTETQFFSFMDWLREDLLQRGARIDKYYFSPCHPTKGLGNFRREDPMRKPNPGMFLAAQKEFGIEMAMSIMVGDKLSDMQASIAAGVGTNLLLGAETTAVDGEINCRRIVSLAEACDYLEH